MITRHFMRTRQLKPGMKLDQTILDRTGRNLVMRGSILDDYVIDSLLRMGIMNVYIQEGEPEPDNIEQMITPEAKKHIERLHKDDPAKVKLSDTADSIASNLMDAINANNAIAIDISTLKTSDEYTFKHSVDVATMAMIIGKQQCLPDKQIYELGVSGLLHDIGKTKVPASILNKPARLTDEEFAVMKQHSVFGYHMLQERNEFNNDICMAVLQHHEKINGNGYPLGFDAPRITPYARILAVADIYDALVTERPYKKAFSQKDAIELIMSMTEELDIKAMKSFLESIILYPVDSIVELSNGEKAKVVSNNNSYILRPTVVGITSGRVYNLGEDMDCANIVII